MNQIESIKTALKGVVTMVAAVIIVLFTILVFGDSFERHADAYIDGIYRDRIDRDELKTHFAIYGLVYWVGFTAFLCVPAMLEVMHAQSANYVLVMSVILIATFAILVKITKMFYAVSAARERALQKYLSE